MTFNDFISLLRGVGLVGITARLLCAIICGGIIGLERESKRRAAGFRTHTLICIGASLTTLISQFMLFELSLPTDPARLGAQVISGMSFIGAGAIIVTSRRQVKGLTTAAGLWTAAIIGLTIGAGYYEGALIATFLVLFAELGLSKLEYYIVSNAKTMTVHIEFTDPGDLDTIVDFISKREMAVNDIEYTKSKSLEASYPSVILTLKLRKKKNHEKTLTMISEIKGVRSVEEV
ncbi:MAG: MgtC/SapB family protein [Clostridia bacterium]|nr:MgtC/SapB family protein [Clostridia bacterium]